MKPNLSRLPEIAKPKIPRVVRVLLKPMPQALLHTSLQFGLNRVFAVDTAHGRLDFLRGKIVSITIPDAAIKFGITRSHDRLTVLSNDLEKADAAVTVALLDVVDLINKSVDPDTLFFRRRLTISGNTELSLELKNFLDTVELPEALIASLPRPFASLLQRNAPALGRPARY